MPESPRKTSKRPGWGNLYDFTGLSGSVAAEPLKLFGKPTTRVENFCASGMDAFRNACFAVASGVYDVVLACGVEKLMDVGGSGLPVDMGHPVMRGASAPAMFALTATRCFHEFGWTREDLAHVAVKNHKNGAPAPQGPLSAADHTGHGVERADDRLAPGALRQLRHVRRGRRAGDHPAGNRQAGQAQARLRAHQGQRTDHARLSADVPGFLRLAGFPATQAAATRAYAEAGIKNPVEEIDLAEVHDCFTITEILNIQDLQFCKRGEGAKFVRDGHADVGGEVAVNASGGLKCFGHPIGATGCRMLCEVTKQLQGRAEGAQVKNARLGWPTTWEARARYAPSLSWGCRSSRGPAEWVVDDLQAVAATGALARPDLRVGERESPVEQRCVESRGPLSCGKG